MRDPAAVGLCFTCRWMRAATNRRGSTFFRCTLADSDERFVRYPPLPVLSCPGYEATMLFVVLMHYVRPLAEVDALRADHLRHLAEHAGRGRFHAWARRDPPVGSVLIAVAPDRATIAAVVAQDPYVTAGVARAEIVELAVGDLQALLQAT